MNIIKWIKSTKIHIKSNIKGEKCINTTGFWASLLGGVISLISGCIIPWIFPEFYIFGEIFVLSFQIILIIGGLITILGAILYTMNAHSSRVLILIGSLVGGLNIISLLAWRKIREDYIFVKAYRESKELFFLNEIKWIYDCPECGAEIKLEYKVCGNCGMENTLRITALEKIENLEKKIEESRAKLSEKIESSREKRSYRARSKGMVGGELIQLDLEANKIKSMKKRLLTEGKEW